MSAQQVTSSMDGLAAWREVLQATRGLAKAVSRLPRDEHRTARLAMSTLAKLDERRATLIALLSLDPAVSLDLVDRLVLIAAMSHRDALVVRQILGRLPRVQLTDPLAAVVTTRLQTADDDEYRRLAELARHLGQEALLRDVVRSALASSDRHIREVGSDFSSRD